MRILIIDDDPAIRKIAAFVLRKEGHEVFEAASGADGLAAAAAQTPDLVLLDWRLPDMGGLEVLRALKAEARTGAAPVLVLTASAQEEYARRAARDGGAVDVLAKPFRPSALPGLISDALARAGGPKG
ncbi:MAG: response regulator [Elusimicrobia bacterium]|nr:response regulator [Elusimicrobiota bacterium]